MNVNWAQQPNLARFWIPDKISHLFYIDIYKDMPPELQLKANHFFALLVVEQIATFERDLLDIVNQKIFKKIIRDAAVTLEFKNALEHFDREEKNHVIMFDRLIEVSNQVLGRKNRYFDMSIFSRFVLRIIFSFPNFLSFWIWVILFVEERTIHVWKEIQKEDAAQFDPLHREVHYAHMMDEARHVQIDEFLLELLWESQPMWIKKMNIGILKLFLKYTFIRSRTSRRLWQKLKKYDARFETYNEQVLSGLNHLQSNKKYLSQIFSVEAAPRFYRLLKKYPEMQNLEVYLNQVLSDK